MGINVTPACVAVAESGPFKDELLYESLTAADLTEVSAYWYSTCNCQGSGICQMASCNAAEPVSFLDCTRKDILKLEGTRWTNDEFLNSVARLVNAIHEILKDQVPTVWCLNTFFTANYGTVVGKDPCDCVAAC